MLNFVSLPGEIRNHIYEAIAKNIAQRIALKNGTVLPHPITQVCRQLREECGGFLESRFISEEKQMLVQSILIHIENFDMSQSVKILRRLNLAANAHLEVCTRVTKPLFRKDWSMLWPWIRYCDELCGHGTKKRNRPSTAYTVRIEQSVCNPLAVSQELYIETVPYILQGATRGGEKCSGYEQIEKIREALYGCLCR